MIGDALCSGGCDGVMILIVSVDSPPHPCIHTSAYSPIHSSIHASTHSSMHQSTDPSIHPSTHLFFYPPTYPCVYPSMYPCIHPPTYIHPSIHPSIIHSIIHSFTWQDFMEYLGLQFHVSLSRLGEGNGNPLQYSCLVNPLDRSLVGYSPWGCKEVDIT